MSKTAYQEDEILSFMHPLSDEELDFFVWDKVYHGHDFNDICRIAKMMHYTDDCEKLKKLYQKAKPFNDTLIKNNETNESKNLKKSTIRLNENTLKKIISESVRRVLKEGMTSDNPKFNKWNKKP